jgi:hypothetical protein
MRIHTDTLTRQDIIAALNHEITAGNVAPQVNFKILSQHGSRSHNRAFEVQLEAAGKIPGDGRRGGNSGSYGAMQDGTFAATYDEWGFFLARLFDLDAALSAGRAYPNRDEFHAVTTDNYVDPAERSSSMLGDYFPYRFAADKAGRMARRYDDGGSTPRRLFTQLIYSPRTRAFPRGAVVTSSSTERVSA